MAALLFSLPSSGISYAATSTKIFTTPITVAKDQSSVTIQFPLPAISGTSVDGHQSFPAFLPTLVISKAVGVVIDAKNKLVNTGTLVQFPPSETDLPSQILDAHEIIGTTRTCLEWRCWPRSVIAGATAAIILCTIGIGFLIWWLLGFPGLQRKRSNSRKHREEEGEHFIIIACLVLPALPLVVRMDITPLVLNGWTNGFSQVNLHPVT